MVSAEVEGEMIHKLGWNGRQRDMKIVYIYLQFI
jgi:hypothetical protein